MKNEIDAPLNTKLPPCSLLSLMLINRLVNELTAIESKLGSSGKDDYLQHLEEHLSKIEKEAIDLMKHVSANNKD